jgi:hypothetical protein
MRFTIKSLLSLLLIASFQNCFAEPTNDPLLFRSEKEFRDAQINRQAANEADIIQGMEKAGVSAAVVNGIKEDFNLQNSGMQIVETNWAAWKLHYNFHELAPPVVYDVRDPWLADFSKPLSAQQSYRHAIYVGDGKTLHQFADETGKKELQRFIGDENIKKPTYEIFPNVTKYTVLFNASTKFEGNDYALVFFRAQENTTPTNGRVMLQADIFKQTTNGYVFTGDLDSSSPFGNPGRAAKLGPLFLNKYPDFYRIASKSEFPEQYYKIDGQSSH